MQLRNKKTDEIIEVNNICTFAKGKHKKYNSLKDFNAEWEDVPEESKRHWIIDTMNDRVEDFDVPMAFNESIGNYFDTKEEAEKAVEKLKAVKRLKDKGFRFEGWTIDDWFKISICTNFESDNIYSESKKEIRTILDLLFGGQDE